MELCWLNPSRRSNTLRILFRRELDSMKALWGSQPPDHGCSAALGIRSPEAEGQGHSPGLLQTVQAEGDTACGLGAESEAAQTLPLWIRLVSGLGWFLDPRHHAGLTPIWGEQVCWGNFIPTPKCHHLPNVNQGTVQPRLRISSLLRSQLTLCFLRSQGWAMGRGWLL